MPAPASGSVCMPLQRGIATPTFPLRACHRSVASPIGHQHLRLHSNGGRGTISWSCKDGNRGTPDGSTSVPPTVKTDAATRLIPTHRRITCVIGSPLWKSREMLMTEMGVPLPCKARGHPGSNPVEVREIGPIRQSLRPGAMSGRGAKAGSNVRTRIPCMTERSLQACGVSANLALHHGLRADRSPTP
jgi:hypothetical protein